MTIAVEQPTRWAVADTKLDGRVPPGPIAEKWDLDKFELKLVNPANRRRHHLIMVGSGLAGAAAAASLGELGYNLSCFCYQDSPRRAHSRPTSPTPSALLTRVIARAICLRSASALPPSSSAMSAQARPSWRN